MGGRTSGHVTPTSRHCFNCEHAVVRPFRLKRGGRWVGNPKNPNHIRVLLGSTKTNNTIPVRCRMGETLASGYVRGLESSILGYDKAETCRSWCMA